MADATRSEQPTLWLVQATMVADLVLVATFAVQIALAMGWLPGYAGLDALRPLMAAGLLVAAGGALWLAYALVRRRSWARIAHVWLGGLLLLLAPPSSLFTPSSAVGLAAGGAQLVLGLLMSCAMLARKTRRWWEIHAVPG